MRPAWIAALGLAALVAGELAASTVLFSEGLRPIPLSSQTSSKLGNISDGGALGAQKLSFTLWGPSGKSGLELFQTPTAGSAPTRIISDGQGGYWFTEQSAGALGHITAAGRVREFPIASRNAGLFGLALGAHNTVWFTEQSAGAVGILYPNGKTKKFSLADSHSSPTGIVAEPDGNVWFTEYGVSRIGRISPAGEMSELSLPSGSAPAGITRGADGNVWFVCSGYGQSALGRVTPSGHLSEFRLPPGAQPFDIAAGGRGLWFTEFGAGRVVFADLSGRTRVYAPPTSGSSPFSIAVDDRGTIWFTELSVDQVGRLKLDTHGRARFQEFILPEQMNSTGIAAGVGSVAWLAIPSSGGVGRLDP